MRKDKITGFAPLVKKMTKDQLDIEREKSFAEFNRRYDDIRKQAQKDGTWSYWGLDANEQLFKELRKEMLQRAQQVRARYEAELGEKKDAE